MLGLILAISAFIVWITGKPGKTPPGKPEELARLAGCMPGDCREGNHITTYTGFFPMMEGLEQSIKSARHHIHFQFFKFEDDPSGNRIATLLAMKAAEGVEVRVLYDDAANLTRKGFYRRLAKSGVQVMPYGRMYLPIIRKKDNYRNHRKVVVVDGRTGFVGGMNIAERYGTGLRWGCWRDTHIRIEGPAASQLQLAFLTDWLYASSQLLADPVYFPAVPGCGSSKVEILTSGPIGEGPVIMHRLSHLLDSAKEYAYLQSPYFIPTRQIMHAMCNAAERGVDVRLIIPYRGDHGVLTPWASKSYIEEAQDSGVKIAFYRIGYMHSKTWVVDDRWTTVGSTNIDVRSYLLDEEANAFIDDPAYARKMKDIFMEDESFSEYIDPQEWKLRSGLERLKQGFARLFSSQL